MALAIPRTANVLQEGDSLSDDAFYRVLHPLRLAAYGFYSSPLPRSTTRSVPSWFNASTSGATTAIVAARIAAEVAVTPPTHFILALGVNDAQTGVLLATTHANFVTIFAALPATCQIIYFDPLMWGEKWPSGQNTSPTIDAAIDAISADVKTLLATTYASRSTFVSWRNGVYAARESQLNTPGPGTTVGPLARPDPIGAQPNTTGIGFITTSAIANVTFPG